MTSPSSLSNRTSTTTHSTAAGPNGASASSATLSLPGIYTSTDELLQLRHIGKELNLSTHKPSQSVIAGSIKTRFRGRGMEFAEVRPYQAGDDIRTIDWRVTARTQQPYTKLFQEERERPVFVLLDQRSPMFFGSQAMFKSVYAAHLATTLGWAALQNNDRIGALVFGDDSQGDIRAKRGKRAQMELIQQVNDFNHRLTSPLSAGESISMLDMLKDMRRVTKPGSAIFLLSDFHDFSEACTEQLALISRHSHITAFHIYDAIEQALPSGHILTIAGQDARMTINTQTVGAAFSEAFTHHQQALHQQLLNARATIIDAPVNAKPEKLLQTVFSARKLAGGAR